MHTELIKVKKKEKKEGGGGTEERVLLRGTYADQKYFLIFTFLPCRRVGFVICQGQLLVCPTHPCTCLNGSQVRQDEQITTEENHTENPGTNYKHQNFTPNNTIQKIGFFLICVLLLWP